MDLWEDNPPNGGVCSHQNLHSTYSRRDLPAMLDETDMGNGKPAIIHMNVFFFRWVAYWTLHVANVWECKPTPSRHSISQCGTWGWQVPGRQWTKRHYSRICARYSSSYEEHGCGSKPRGLHLANHKIAGKCMFILHKYGIDANWSIPISTMSTPKSLRIFQPYNDNPPAIELRYGSHGLKYNFPGPTVSHCQRLYPHSCWFYRIISQYINIFRVCRVLSN